MDASVFFENRVDWRNWLEVNHAKENYVWLTIYKKGSSKKGVTLGEAVEEALCFGWIDGKIKRVDEETFVSRFSPRKANSVWSKINKERAEKLIASGRMTAAGLTKIEEAKKTNNWNNAYTNITTDEVPSDLKGALLKENKAWANFQNFANSYKNMYIGWINQAKTEETRLNRIRKVVEQSLKNKKIP